MLITDKVLVIDDDPDSLAATTELLESAGWSVVTAKNGLDALQQLHEGLRPRAMLIDLTMPFMDGRTFCEICDVEPLFMKIPRIIVSAERNVKALRYRANAVVPKPVQRQALLKALNEDFCLTA